MTSTAIELRKEFPLINFIKTKEFIDRPNVELLKSNFIPDEDMPEFPVLENLGTRQSTRVYPLSVKEYPSVLKRMTATEAGAWAISKCRQQHWSICLENIQSCLANLEMDY